jgi:hypothetical protein
MVKERDLPAERLKGIVPQPFQPYNSLRQFRARFFAVAGCLTGSA